MRAEPETNMQRLYRRDAAIFFVMAVLAGCGLVYEYLLSHYAGRVLGAMESTIYGIIGIMIVSMGVGSFLARLIRCPFTGFAWLEVFIAILGSSSVLLIAAVFALSTLFPRILGDTFGLPPDLLPSGGAIIVAERIAGVMPYLTAAVLGTMIGMEIPLIARVREEYYGQHLKHNTGSIYGVDYIGAGIGAALWVMLMLSMDISLAAAFTAGANILVGVLFLVLFRENIKKKGLLLGAHILTAGLVLAVATYGSDWDAAMEDMLYTDKVVYRLNTKFQHLTVTERIMDPAKPPVSYFYINGRTQFASYDERIYHSLLVYPAMAASARHERVLVIGGGDGLALRDILRWDPKKVVLIDLDRGLVDFFTHPVAVNGRPINGRLLELNNRAFSDPRVEVRIGDAFNKVDEFLRGGDYFDTIVVDLPDPAHPDLNKLYSSRFYAKLLPLLAGDGAMVVQSTSPYHAKHAFLSIGKTIGHSGFAHVEQYHHNVPSFGEWGWTIATKNGLTPKQRLAALKELPVDDGWITKGIMLGAFEFGRHYFDDIERVRINRLGTLNAYQYHQTDWEKQQGIYAP